MPLQENATILSNEQVKPGYYLMQLKTPKVAAEAKPGQFVHVRVCGTMDPLLRRPISLYQIDSAEGTITLLYVVVGRGTKMLSQMEQGAELDLMGPLGTGFWVPENVSRCLIIGGGIGVAPLLPVTQILGAQGIEQQVIYGFRNADTVVGIDELKKQGVNLSIATDDGSVGTKGYVTDLAGQAVKEFKPDYYYTCGPEVMIQKVVSLMGEYGIKGQVSLEARMGCGVGACLACTCKGKKVASGQWPVASEKAGAEFDYKMVCTHGPVFSADEVMFDE